MKHSSKTRERDKFVIMAVVRQFGPLSRVNIHELTGIRPTTISFLVRELLDEGKLLETGLSNNPTGRKQILLRINPQQGFLVGIDYDAESVIVSTMDLTPSVKNTIQKAAKLDGGIKGLTQQLVSLTRKAIGQQDRESGPLLGIGIADPGLIDSHEGVSLLSSQIEFWRDVPLKKIFEPEFGAPFLLENGTRARVVAERALQSHETAQEMVYLEYGAGIGLGVISGGRLLRGHSEGAGEFGHTHLIENGPPCKCGSFGCLEAIVAAPALAARAKKAITEGSGSQILELSDGDPEQITGWTVLKAAKLGDKLAATLMEDLGKYLGMALANAVNLFNPSLVVLDQRLQLAGPGILDQIQRAVRRLALRHLTENLSFRFSALGGQAGVLGVGLLLLDRHFEIPSLKAPKFLIQSPPSHFSKRSFIQQDLLSSSGDTQSTRLDS